MEIYGEGERTSHLGPLLDRAREHCFPTEGSTKALNKSISCTVSKPQRLCGRQEPPPLPPRRLLQGGGPQGSLHRKQTGVGAAGAQVCPVHQLGVLLPRAEWGIGHPLCLSGAAEASEANTGAALSVGPGCDLGLTSPFQLGSPSSSPGPSTSHHPALCASSPAALAPSQFFLPDLRTPLHLHGEWGRVRFFSHSTNTVEVYAGPGAVPGVGEAW